MNSKLKNELDYSVIILNYNGDSILGKSIEHTLKAMRFCTEFKGELIVVDNASTDGSKAIIDGYSEQLVPLLLDKNTILQGYNKAALQARGKYLVLLNNDEFLDEDFFNLAFSPFANNDKLFQVCIQNLNESTRTYQSGKGLGELKKGQIWLDFETSTPEVADQVFAGGLGVYRKDIFLELGGFHLLYHPFYWEDADLSYNAWKQGYEVVYEPKAKAEHRHQATIGNFDMKTVRYINRRNKVIFFWLNVTTFQYWLHHILFYPVFALKWWIDKKETDYIRIPFALLFRSFSILKEKLKRVSQTKLKDTDVSTLLDKR